MRPLSLLLAVCLTLLLFSVSCQRKTSVGNEQRAFEAVRLGDAETLRRILDNHPEVVRAKESSYGATLLHLAARQGLVPLMDTLVRHGSSLDARDSIGRTPLHYALAAGKLQAAIWLIEKGADWRLEGEGGLTCLHYAAISDNPALVQLCVQKGISANAVSLLGTPLHFAALGNASKTAAELVRQGASVDAITPQSKETPLHLAAARDAFEVADVLLRHGAQVNARSALGWTPLHSACNTAAGTRVARLLLQRGANPNATDTTGRTPLFYLVTRSNIPGNNVPPEMRDVLSRHQQNTRAQALALAQLLLSMGANPRVRDATGATPADLAARSGFKEMEKLLRQR